MNVWFAHTECDLLLEIPIEEPPEVKLYVYCPRCGEKLVEHDRTAHDDSERYKTL